MKRVFRGWIPGNETRKETLKTIRGDGVNITLFKTEKECIEDSITIKAKKCKITIIIEDN